MKNMKTEWINDSKANDGSEHSCYTLENNFACVVVRVAYSDETEHAGQWRAIFNTEYMHPVPMFVIGPKDQSDEWFSSFDSAVVAGEKWFDEVSEKCAAAIAEEIAAYRKVAVTKGFKDGWVWHQIKNKYTADIANEFLSK